MKTETLLDIIFCILVMPGMMFLFPTGEWLQWHASYVLGYALWLYGVWLLCRMALGPLLLMGWKGKVTVALSLFLVGAVTFLMSLTPVQFPENTKEIGDMLPHVRAMWILLLAVVSYALPVGALSKQSAQLQEVKELEEAMDDAREALETRRIEGISGGEINVKSDYKTVPIPLSAIQYIEGRNNYACFHLDHREDIVTQLPLKEVLAQLPEGKFVRIHRSYIVPLWRIEQRNSTRVQLLGIKDPLPVGRAYKENLKNG
ncbi:MAG: LytTR family transcriptional regulator [Bacteroidales bacterium]|nr:LytTR family transcriptional regulator [Bacteroidales bacterium]